MGFCAPAFQFHWLEPLASASEGLEILIRDTIEQILLGAPMMDSGYSDKFLRSELELHKLFEFFDLFSSFGFFEFFQLLN